jgi:ribosomal protein S18 acetylase RimI-like enzyme
MSKYCAKSTKHVFQSPTTTISTRMLFSDATKVSISSPTMGALLSVRFVHEWSPYLQYATRSQLYIMTLAVLAAYRGREVGTQLIQSVLDHYEAHKDDEFASVDVIALHVQISNNDAIRFYRDRFGFAQGRNGRELLSQNRPSPLLSFI